MVAGDHVPVIIEVVAKTGTDFRADSPIEAKLERHLLELLL
jgi:hypothetical protein